MANWQRGMLRLMRVANHPVTVTQIEDLTPWYRRITFSAPDLVRDLEVFPTLWLRLWVPHPEKPGEVVQRGYTFTEVRPEAGTFALEFVLHEAAGPAGDWAKNVAIGEVREVALTPREPVLPVGVTSLVLVGDVTALPAINSWLPQWASHDDDGPQAQPAITVLVEDPHPLADLQQLPRAATHAPLDWHWVSQDGPPGAALAARLTELVQPGEPHYLWGAGEKGLVKAVREVAKGHLNLDRAHQFSQFYWIEGKATG